MHILLVDNASLHINELEDELSQYANKITKQRFNEIDFEHANFPDLILLSGNSGVPYHTQKEAFDRETEYIKRTQIPIIGICYGLKMIVHAFGGKSEVMNNPAKGVMQIQVVENDPIFRGKTSFEVFESHKAIIYENEVGPELMPLAISKDGVEIVRHKTKLVYGFQFHPEVHTDKNEGYLLLKNAILELINKSQARPY